MNFKNDWNEFWFRSVPGGPVALVRIAMGLLVIAAALQLWPDRMAWFSEHGVLTTPQAIAFNQAYTAGPRLITFLYGASDSAINLFFVAYFIAAFLMTIGLWTRPAILLVWLGLNAIHNRNMVVNTTGGDQVMLIFTAYLFFARSDAAISVSRLLRIRAGKEGVDAPLIAIWPQRMMQLQVSIVYLSTFLNKAPGQTWEHGIAAYLPYMVREFHRFRVPFMDPHHLWFIELVTYSTLAIEFMLGTLVWVPRLRLKILTLGVLLHLGIEYSMNIPLFAFLMMASYLSFLKQTDLAVFRKWLKRRLKIDVPNAVDFVKGRGGGTTEVKLPVVVGE